MPTLTPTNLKKNKIQKQPQPQPIHIFQQTDFQFQHLKHSQDYINNVILYLNNLQSFTPIQQISARIYGNNTENQSYLSYSFK